MDQQIDVVDVNWKKTTEPKFPFSNIYEEIKAQNRKNNQVLIWYLSRQLRSICPAWGLEQHKNEKLSTSCPALNSGNQSQSSLPMTQGHTFMLFYSCEAQARVRQGSARDGPLRRKALKLKPLPRAYIKVGCHPPTHHHHPPGHLILLNYFRFHI